MSYYDQPYYDDPLLSEYEERFLEQHFTQDFDVPFDMLDVLEASIEDSTHDGISSSPPLNHRSKNELIRDPLWDQMAKIESDIEGLEIPPPPVVEPHEGGPPPVEENRKTVNPLPGDDPNIVREGTLPRHRMSGGGRGIKNPESNHIICYRRDEYIERSECKNCDYYRETEDGYMCVYNE